MRCDYAANSDLDSSSRMCAAAGRWATEISSVSVDPSAQAQVHNDSNVRQLRSTPVCFHTLCSFFFLSFPHPICWIPLLGTTSAAQFHPPIHGLHMHVSRVGRSIPTTKTKQKISAGWYPTNSVLHVLYWCKSMFGTPIPFIIASGLMSAPPRTNVIPG